MQNKLQITNLSPKSSLKEESRPVARFSSVNFSSHHIHINKNEISFSSLSSQIRCIFIFTLTICYNLRLLKQVFYRWESARRKHSAPQRIILSDDQSIQLIWRMNKAISQKKGNERLAQLKIDVEALQNEYILVGKTYKDISAKGETVQRSQLSQSQSQKYVKFVQKMKHSKEWMENKLYELNVQIQQKTQDIKKCEESQKFSIKFNFRLKCRLTKAIIKEVRYLLKQTIIGILQISKEIVKEGEVDNQQVYVVFQQAYKTIRIAKSTIIKYLGSDFYLSKVELFNGLMQQRKDMSQKQLKDANILCCHRCMKIDNSKNLRFCKTTIGKKQLNPYLSSDYIMYHKNYMEGDFFYKPIQSHVISYNVYSKDAKNKSACNRAYCKQCIESYYSEISSSCPYCQGLCCCPRCQKAVAIVRLMALNYPNDLESKYKYHELLRILGGKDHKNVSKSLKLRLPNQLDQYKQWRQVYQNLKKRYTNIKLLISLPSIQILPVCELEKIESLSAYQRNRQYEDWKQLKPPSITKAGREKNQQNKAVLAEIDDEYFSELLEPALSQQQSFTKYFEMPEEKVNKDNL